MHQMVKETIESATKNETFDELVILKLSKIIAGVPKPEKAFVIENQKSKLGKWIFIF